MSAGSRAAAYHAGMAGTRTAAPNTDAAPATDARTRLAPRYRVLIHNDDVTPMDFVVHVLTGVFAKPQPEAITIMLEAHHAGVALVAVLGYEQAEHRVGQAHSLARARTLPLTFTLEPA